jgi:hypothetical protein
MIIRNKLSSMQKILIGIILLGIIGSILLMINGIQNIIILIYEKVVLGGPLDHDKAHSILTKKSILLSGIFSRSLIIVIIIFYKQLLSTIDSFLNKALIKQICEVSVKEILIKQPFLLILFIFILYFLKNIFLLINIIGFDRIILFITFLIHILVSLFVYLKNDKKSIFTSIIVCYFIIGFSMLINSFIFDYSFDGHWYHQSAAIQLKNGWNPFYTSLPEDGVSIWNNHYPRFTEMFASIFLSVFNNIELGKSYNMIFFIILFLYVLKYVSKFQRNKLVVMAISIIFIANPVVLAQFFTYYVDGVMGMLIIILLFTCMEYEQSQNITDLFIIIAVSVFSINTKFTGFICGFILIAYIIKQIILKKYKMMLIFVCTGFAILMISVLFIGYNPYITNLINYGHPFYPLYGNKTINIIPDDWTKGFNTIKGFFSLFFLDYSEKNMPFNPDKLAGLKLQNTYDSIVGGFGVLFIEICILFILVYFITIKNKKSIYKKLLFPMLILLFISIIMPANRWARYIPFFWYLLGFLAITGDYKNILNRKILLVCFIMVLINSGSFLYNNAQNGIIHTKYMKSALKEMKESSQDTIHIELFYYDFRYYFAEKLRYYNIQKNVVFIKQNENISHDNGIPYSNINGWY